MKRVLLNYNSNNIFPLPKKNNELLPVEISTNISTGSSLLTMSGVFSAASSRPSVLITVRVFPQPPITNHFKINKLDWHYINIFVFSEHHFQKIFSKFSSPRGARLESENWLGRNDWWEFQNYYFLDYPSDHFNQIIYRNHGGKVKLPIS